MIGTWLTALNARYRDVRYVVPFLVQILLFLSPIAYSTSRVSFPSRRATRSRRQTCPTSGQSR